MNGGLRTSGMVTIILAFLFLLYSLSQLAHYRDWSTDIILLVEIITLGFFMLFLIIGLRDIILSQQNENTGKSIE